jgi:predicted Zn finger-like uncharacterized protein
MIIIECDRCYARYRYDETRFEGKASKRVRCTKCLAIFEIFNTASAEPVPFPVRPGEETVSRLDPETQKPRPPTAKRPAPGPGGHTPLADLKLPAAHKVSVAVIAGPEAGRIYPIENPRVVIGRHDADINVDDPEVSRSHAAIEISGEKLMLVDLGSTNGTFVGEERIRECPLENQTEFSVGGSTLMLILTPKG